MTKGPSRGSPRARTPAGRFLSICLLGFRNRLCVRDEPRLHAQGTRPEEVRVLTEITGGDLGSQPRSLGLPSPLVSRERGAAPTPAAGLALGVHVSPRAGRPGRSPCIGRPLAWRCSELFPTRTS